MGAKREQQSVPVLILWCCLAARGGSGAGPLHLPPQEGTGIDRDAWGYPGMLQDHPSFWDYSSLSPLPTCKDALGIPKDAWEYPGKLRDTQCCHSSWCWSLILSLPLAWMLRDILGTSKNSPELSQLLGWTAEHPGDAQGSSPLR